MYMYCTCTVHVHVHVHSKIKGHFIRLSDKLHLTHPDNECSYIIPFRHSIIK